MYIVSEEQTDIDEEHVRKYSKVMQQLVESRMAKDMQYGSDEVMGIPPETPGKGCTIT